MSNFVSKDRREVLKVDKYTGIDSDGVIEPSLEKFTNEELIDYSRKLQQNIKDDNQAFRLYRDKISEKIGNYEEIIEQMEETIHNLSKIIEEKENNKIQEKYKVVNIDPNKRKSNEPLLFNSAIIFKDENN